MIVMETEFRETQRFNQWWIWLVGLFPIGLVFFEFMGVIFGKEKLPPEAIMAIVLVMILVVSSFVWIKTMRLETLINHSEISIKYIGLFTKKKFYWSDIETAEVIKYDPLWEYGGWGIKYGFKRGWCYNVAGDEGLFLNLKNGKKYLIGTQKASELKEFITSLA